MSKEDQAEWQYRYDERVGMLCEDKQPTEQEHAIAKRHADAWLLDNGQLQQGELIC